MGAAGEITSLVRHGYVYGEAPNGVGFFRAQSLMDEPWVNHGFSARIGGVSGGALSSLNLSYGRPDARENVRENFSRFCEAAQIPYDSLVMVAYEHGTNVLRVDQSDSGRGMDAALPPLSPCDGIVTNDPDVTLATLHADCGTFFLFDPVHHAIGLAHAGWKGMLGRIGGRMVELMRREFGSEPHDIIAANGPCICMDCFEVDAELADQFVTEFDCPACCRDGRPTKKQLDLELPAAIQLMDAGVRPENITLMHACTYELSALLYSHRRDHGQTGAMAAYMRLNPQ